MQDTDSTDTVLACDACGRSLTFADANIGSGFHGEPRVWCSLECEGELFPFTCAACGAGLSSSDAVFGGDASDTMCPDCAFGID